jgi:hypothetical protein
MNAKKPAVYRGAMTLVLLIGALLGSNTARPAVASHQRGRLPRQISTAILLPAPMSAALVIGASKQHRAVAECWGQ